MLNEKNDNSNKPEIAILPKFIPLGLNINRQNTYNAFEYIAIFSKLCSVM
jgi:hypothetical protein